jgi:hypothetical protein
MLETIFLFYNTDMTFVKKKKKSRVARLRSITTLVLYNNYEIKILYITLLLKQINTFPKMYLDGFKFIYIYIKFIYGFKFKSNIYEK